MRHGLLLSCLLALLLAGCGSDSESDDLPPAGDFDLSLSLTRDAKSGLDDIHVTFTITENGSPTSGADPDIAISDGNRSSVTDNGDGTYDFTITPDRTGVFDIDVSYRDAAASANALVFDKVGQALGQPMSVPGDFVNTAGYEDGVTVSPDGEYLFVQYGPVYFSGILYLNTICSDPDYSQNNVNDCPGRANSDWVFRTIGPYGGSMRPDFPDGRIADGVLYHLDSIVVPGVVNGLFVPPTAFYGFKRQPDGTFAEPFKLAFDDENRGIQSPYGLSLQLRDNGYARFSLAWNNQMDNLGDDGTDLYYGQFPLGRPTSLGNVTYNGDIVSSANPDMAPVPLPSHAGVQGNSHLHIGSDGNIDSLWFDDEVNSHDIGVYTLTAGSFPDGDWQEIVLPSKINTAQHESQPYFDGQRLYLRRENRIVYHEFLSDSLSDLALEAAWSDARLILESEIHPETGSMVAVGEPTIAQWNGKSWLYFAYGVNRASGVDGLIDINMEAGFVEIEE